MRTNEKIDAKWLIGTCGLADKYGTGLVFGKDRSVYGFPKGAGWSVCVSYPVGDAGADTVDAVLARFPDGACFGEDGKAVKGYAKLDYDPDAPAMFTIDPATNVVKVTSGRIRLSSAALVANNMPLPTLADPSMFADLDLAELVPKRVLSALCESASKDESRPALVRVFCSDFRGERHLCATNGRIAILHKVGDAVPDGFSVNDKKVRLKDIAGYYMETDKSANAESGVTHCYRLRDGVTVVERMGKNVVFPSGFDMVVGNWFEGDPLGSLTPEYAAEIVSGVTRLGLASAAMVQGLENGNVRVLESASGVLAEFEGGGGRSSGSPESCTDTGMFITAAKLGFGIDARRSEHTDSAGTKLYTHAVTFGNGETCGVVMGIRLM